MTKFITVASAKGGTGKTTTALNIGFFLTQLGYDNVVVDTNLETPHIGLFLGRPIVENSIHDALKGEKHIADTAYSHRSGMKVIPGKLNEEDIRHERLGEVLEDLIGSVGMVVADTAAGVGEDVKQTFKVSNEILIVTTPDILSVTDALKTIKLAGDFGKKVKGIVLNKVQGEKHEMTKQNVEEILEKPVLATIPFDLSIERAMRRNLPIAYAEPRALVSEEFKKLTLQLLQ